MIVQAAQKSINVALAGAPNVGKSTVFNLLTGLSQHVGNWPGKTIEQKTGVYSQDNLTMNIIDLPGAYSLTANSAEEQIARDYLVKEKPDIVVAVINAASLERNLYLVAELIELAPRLVIALNMMDVAQQHGMQIDSEALAGELDIQVVPIIASKNQGMDQLVKAISNECMQPLRSREAKHVEYGKEINKVIKRVEELLDQEITTPYPVHWTAMKLLEGDEQINHLIQQRMPTERIGLLNAYLTQHESAAVTIATLRFEWVTRITDIIQKKHHLGQVSLTEKIDRVATHPVLGIIMLAAVLGVIFWIVYSAGVPIQGFLEVNIIQKCQEFVSQELAFLPALLKGFLNDGILGGVGIVLTFIPILFFFFMFWALLEDVGYTSRAAFVTDRFMHLLGLHGKSSMPLVLGFGCNVPAVLGTRIIESKRARLLTILLAPLVPCTGRMAVISIIAAAFFGRMAAFVSIGIALFSIIMLVIIGFILNRFVIRDENVPLIMELPLYHIPNLRTIGLTTWYNLEAFIKRAGTIILIVSVIVWLLSAIPTGNIHDSILAQFGKLIEPAGRLMGLNWQMLLALITSFIAKENTIATVGVLLGGEGTGLAQQLQAMLTPAAALAFLVIQVLFIPCVATVAVMRQETGGWRWTIFMVALQLVLSFSLAIVVFQVFSLLI